MHAPSQAVQREQDGAHAKAPAGRGTARGVAAGVPEFLRQDGRAADEVRVQRQEEEAPSAFQLTPPSLLQPPPTPSIFGDQFQLKLDPEIQMQIAAILIGGLRPERVQQGLQQLNPGDAGASASPQGAGDAQLVPPSPTLPAGSAPESGPDVAGPAQPASPGAAPSPSPAIVPEGSYPAGFGIWYALVMSMPQVQAATAELSAHGRRISDDLGTGGLVGLGIATALATATAVVPLSMDPRYRDPALRAGWDALNGAILPVPGTPAHAEFSVSGGNFMIGLHVDMAPIMPEWFGLGSRGFLGPGSLLQPLPALRSARNDAMPAVNAPALAHAIRNVPPGTPLPADVLRPVQRATGVDLSDVTVHTDGRADELARALDATAFASGADLFFRSDAYDADSVAGRRLIAHEAAHAAQQRRGRVDGVELGAGLLVNRPGDPLERAADGVASSLDAASPVPAAETAASASAGTIAVQRQPAGMTSGEAPMSVAAPEPNASYPQEELRYTIMLTSGTRSDLTEEEAIAALNDVLHKTNLEFELGSGEHRELKKARDGNILIGVGGFLTDLVGDDLPPLSIWTPARKHLSAASGALGARNVEGAAASLRAAHDAYVLAAAEYNGYLGQLQESADFATVAIVVVAVLAVVVAAGVFVAGTTAAAGGAGATATGATATGATATGATATGATATGATATGATATGATATGATATGATATGATATGATATGATATGATATGATATGATAAGTQITSSTVLHIIESVASLMGNKAALHAFLMRYAATSGGRAMLLAAARVAAACSLQPGVTRADFQMLKQVSELLFTFARGGK